MLSVTHPPFSRDKSVLEMSPPKLRTSSSNSRTIFVNFSTSVTFGLLATLGTLSPVFGALLATLPLDDLSLFLFALQSPSLLFPSFASECFAKFSSTTTSSTWIVSIGTVTSGVSFSSQFLHLKTFLFFSALSQGMVTHLLCIHLLQAVHTIVGKPVWIIFWHIPQIYLAFLLASPNLQLLFLIISLISFIATSSLRKAWQLLQIETCRTEGFARPTSSQRVSRRYSS